MSSDPGRARGLPAAWGEHRTSAPTPRSITQLVRDHVLDAELGALLWVLLDVRAPVVVVGAPASGRTTLATALLDLLPAGSRPIPLRGAEEEFEWLPEAPELGWRRERATRAQSGVQAPGADPSTAVLLVHALGGGPPRGTFGPRARIAIRALSLGYGMVATMAGDGLEDVFAVLRQPGIEADDDELSRLGIVLVLRAVPAEDDKSGISASARRRIAAAHYVRPVVRDAHGHVQRLPPAVLAAWESRTDVLEHFAWGIAPELAARTGRTPADFELEQARRASYLAGLAGAGIVDPDVVRTAIAGYREAALGRPD